MRLQFDHLLVNESNNKLQFECEDLRMENHKLKNDTPSSSMSIKCNSIKWGSISITSCRWHRYKQNIINSVSSYLK